MTEEELMRRYREGDSAAFDMLYQRHSGKVYAYLRKKLSSQEEAEEVFQATFMKFHRSRQIYDPKYPVLQWLFVIVKSSLTDHYRKLGRQVPITDQAIENYSDISSQNERDEALSEERVATILQGLPPDQREIVERRVIKEDSYEEIAMSLKRSEAGVRQIVSRALRKLKNHLSASERRSR